MRNVVSAESMMEGVDDEDVFAGALSAAGARPIAASTPHGR